MSITVKSALSILFVAAVALLLAGIAASVPTHPMKAGTTVQQITVIPIPEKIVWVK